jgi:hypothetical protein
MQYTSLLTVSKLNNNDKIPHLQKKKNITKVRFLNSHGSDYEEYYSSGTLPNYMAQHPRRYNSSTPVP